MSLIAFISAGLALLLAPGPTNTLMGVAGAQGGLRRVARLVPAELGGYLTAVLPLVCIGAQMLARWPSAAVALKLAAAVWVMVLAVRLWGIGGKGAALDAVTGRRVYVTTLLNPKALIFGLVLLPGPLEPDFAPKLGLFCAMVIGAALAWGGAGALMQAGDAGEGRLRNIRRVASVWLAFVSVTLVAGVLRP